MSLFALLQAGCLVMFALLLLAAGWQDIRSMRIANGVSLAVVATFVAWQLTGIDTGRSFIEGLAAAILCAVAVFGVGAIAFAAGLFGGGDVKLLAAASLFAGPSLLLDFLTITAVAGGIMAAAVLAGLQIGPVLPERDGTLRARLRSGLPYGPAIAVGGLWVAAAHLVS
jgi:prepilin peptidase CpaA